MQERHADAIYRMYEVAGLNVRTATEAEKASLRLRLVGEARKGGMRFPARPMGRAEEFRDRRRTMPGPPLGLKEGPGFAYERTILYARTREIRRRRHLALRGPKSDRHVNHP
jgi:hypothetical protein